LDQAIVLPGSAAHSVDLGILEERVNDLVRDAPDHQPVGTHGAGLDDPAIQRADSDLASVDCGDHLVAHRLGDPAETLEPVPLADDVIADDPEPGVAIDLLAVS